MKQNKTPKKSARPSAQPKVQMSVKSTRTAQLGAPSSAVMSRSVQSASVSDYTPLVAALADKTLSMIEKREKKDSGKPKKKKDWKDWLSSAAKTALKAVPTMMQFAPLLLATNEASAQAASSDGHDVAALRQTTPGMSIAAPTAMGQAFAGNVGVHSVSSIFKRGRLYGLRISGVDKVMDVTIPSSAVSGQILASIPLAIGDSAWKGTKIFNFGLDYERVKYNRVAFIYAPSVPTTQNGQVILAATVDPDFSISAGYRGTQEAISIPGAGWCNAFASTECEWTGDSSQLFYVDSGTSEQRFYSGGQVFVMADTPITVAAETTLASVFAFYDITLECPTEGQSLTDAGFVAMSLTGTLKNATNPFGEVSGWGAMEYQGDGVLPAEGPVLNNRLIGVLKHQPIAGASLVSEFPSNILYDVTIYGNLVTSTTAAVISVPPGYPTPTYWFSDHVGSPFFADDWNNTAILAERANHVMVAWSSDVSPEHRALTFAISGSGDVVASALSVTPRGIFTTQALVTMQMKQEARKLENLQAKEKSNEHKLRLMERYLVDSTKKKPDDPEKLKELLSDFEKDLDSEHIPKQRWMPIGPPLPPPVSETCAVADSPWDRLVKQFPTFSGVMDDSARRALIERFSPDSTPY